MPPRPAYQSMINQQTHYDFWIISLLQLPTFPELRLELPVLVKEREYCGVDA